MKIMPVQKQTQAGQRTRFKAFVAIGDSDGHLGLGVKCAKEVATAIRGAIILAKLSVVPVRRGYWGAKLGEPHTVPSKVEGKCASVYVKLIPACVHFSLALLSRSLPFCTALVVPVSLLPQLPSACCNWPVSLMSTLNQEETRPPWVTLSSLASSPSRRLTRSLPLVRLNKTLYRVILSSFHVQTCGLKSLLLSFLWLSTLATSR